MEIIVKKIKQKKKCQVIGTFKKVLHIIVFYINNTTHSFIFGKEIGNIAMK
jgi:hypothetical protein